MFVAELERKAEPMTARFLVAVGVILLLNLQQVVAQEKLVDMVRRVGRSIEVATSREFSPAGLDDLVGASDLIARVLVTGGRSRISRNELSIETDYDATVLHAYGKGIDGLAGSRITVTKPGGVVTIEGHRIVGYEPDFPDFVSGSEYLLFLVNDPSSDSYLVSHGAQGAFRHEAGLLDQVSKFDGKFKSERGKVPFELMRAGAYQLVACGGCRSSPGS